jgi:hypothetical protein
MFEKNPRCSRIGVGNPTIPLKHRSDLVVNHRRTCRGPRVSKRTLEQAAAVRILARPWTAGPKGSASSSSGSRAAETGAPRKAAARPGPQRAPQQQAGQHHTPPADRQDQAQDKTQVQALEKGIEPQLVSERMSELRGDKEAPRRHCPRSGPSARRRRTRSRISASAISRAYRADHHGREGQTPRGEQHRASTTPGRRRSAHRTAGAAGRTGTPPA